MRNYNFAIQELFFFYFEKKRKFLCDATLTAEDEQRNQLS